MTPKEAADLYKDKARSEGLLPGELILLSPKIQALSRPQETESIHLLNPRHIPIQYPEGTAADTDKEEALHKALTQFRSLWSDQSPFIYLSKYAFAEDLLSAEPSPELLLRFVTDRSFYFEQYRELGNWPGDKEHPPAPSIAGCIVDDDFWRIYEKTPADLLKQGLERMESEFKGKYADRPTSKKTDDASDELWYGLATAAFQQMMDPEPQIVIASQKLLKSFEEKCKNANIAKPNEKIEKLLFGCYQYLIEEYELVQLTVKQECLPTNIHFMFYKESNDNYNHLCQEMQRRKDRLLSKDRLLKELNSLALRTASMPERDRETYSMIPKRVILKLPDVLDTFETYARSQLCTARRAEFQEIRTHQDCANQNIGHPEVWRKPYTVSICRLLEACWTNDEWHILTPLFLYHAFTRNSQAVIWNSKKKLVKKIVFSSQAASVQNMVSTTGYRAGINLVLYQKLCLLFCRQSQDCCLLGREKDSCAKIPHSDPSIRCRINISGCALKSKSENGNECENKSTIKTKGCPFCCSGKDWNDFGFYLTTGYGYLYHHYPVDDIIQISDNEIYKEKMNESEDGEDNEIVSQCVEKNEKTYSVYRYRYNLKKPVGVLEGLLEHHIRNCIPNRPRNLTPSTPNVYRTNTLNLPYEELSNLLLQDMHLPAMQRISRYIKRMLSEHPEYVEQFRLYLRYPWASGERSQALDDIIERHGIEALILRYSDYSLSSYSYSVYDSLRAILEYMIHAQLIEEVENKLRPLVRNGIGKELFAYPPRERKPRKKKERLSEPSNT